MSRDSSRTYIHLHKPHHADLFEEFTSRNPLGASSPASPGGAAAAAANLNPPSMHPLSMPPIMNPMPLGNTTQLASEDIVIAPQHQPPNPEDEDDVVPDQHAAFGITRAMAMRENQRANSESWRDFGSLMERVRGEELSGNSTSGQGTSQNQPSPLRFPFSPRQQQQQPSSQAQRSDMGPSN